jgi:uncharacterized protein YqeY
MAADLRQRLTDDMKASLRAGDKRRLGAIRLILADVKQVEVDERVVVDDQRMLAILDRMAKRRRDALGQFRQAGRDDLADQEQFELDLIATYLPQALGDAEIAEHIAAAIAETGAAGVKDMGRVMGVLQPRLKGRADMAEVSRQVRARLQ